MTGIELMEALEAAQESIFRLQSLPSYSVEEEKAEFNRFLAGELQPDKLENINWFNFLNGKIAAGVKVTNLHVLPETLTPYLRYAIDWAYIDRQLAGEQILFIGVDDARRCDPPVSQDFLVIDDTVVVLMRYDADGRFLAFERVTAPEKIARYVAIRDTAIQNAFELQSLLARRRRGLIY